MSAIGRNIYKGLFGLQFRTTVLLTGIVLAATGLTGALYLRMATRLIAQEAESHARDLAHAIAVSSIADVEAEDQFRLLAIAESAVKNGNLAYLIFADMTGRMIASYQRGAGSINHLILDDARHISVEPINRPLFLDEGGGPSIDVVFPIHALGLVADPSLSTPTIGYVRLGVSMRAAEVRLSSLVRNVIGLGAAVALLMVPIGYQVVRHLIGPLENLSQAARSIATGKLEARVEVNRRDEIGELAGAFNGMADDLARSHSQLVKLNAELEERVSSRTKALEEANRMLRDMAARDSLTGLYNRRHFNELLAQLCAESTRYGTDLTCMMIDLDNFKRVNDSLGHQTGDRLLQMAADVIQSTIRESDVAIRYGGDEFAVLLPQTSPANAVNSAERILTNFRAHIERHLPEANLVSLSIGVASRTGAEPIVAAELVALADEALYLAKAGGRNRVTLATPPQCNLLGAGI